MKQLVVWLAVLVTVALVTTGANAAPLEVYGRLPTLSNVAISQDGSELAYVTSDGIQQAVILRSIDSRQTLASINVGTRIIARIEFAGSSHILITEFETGTVAGIFGVRHEWFVIQDYNLQTRKFTTLLESVGRGISAATGLPKVRIVDGHVLAFVPSLLFKSYYGVATLFKIDLDTGDTSVANTGHERVEDWLLNSKGELVARTEYDNSAGHWHVTLRGHENLREAYGVDAPVDVPVADVFSPDGNAIIIREFDNGILTYKQLDIGSATVSPVTQWGQDAPILVRDPLTDRVIVSETAGVHGELVHHFFDPHDQAIWNGISAAYPGETVRYIGASNDKSRIVVWVDGAKDAAEFVLVDRKTHSAEPVGPSYRGITPSDVAEVQYITYAAADGLTIPAYLTLPKGRPPKNLPLVVLPHDGPGTRDIPGFDWWPQAIASRGYAVLQPEYRGSFGFDARFFTAGFGQWGRKMQTDLSDGVRHLSAQGIVDPARVCIAGMNYAGYAAVAGAALEHGVYKCAVSYSGISDPHSFLQFEKDRYDIRDDPFLRYWNRFLGSVSLDDPILNNISPLAHSADVGIPILLMHSQADTIIPVEQSQQMDSALRAAGKQVQFNQFDGTDHWLYDPTVRLKMLQATVDFLEKNNPPN